MCSLRLLTMFRELERTRSAPDVYQTRSLLLRADHPGSPPTAPRRSRSPTVVLLHHRRLGAVLITVSSDGLGSSGAWWRTGHSVSCRDSNFIQTPAGISLGCVAAHNPSTTMLRCLPRRRSRSQAVARDVLHRDDTSAQQGHASAPTVGMLGPPLPLACTPRPRSNALAIPVSNYPASQGISGDGVEARRTSLTRPELETAGTLAPRARKIHPLPTPRLEITPRCRRR